MPILPAGSYSPGSLRAPGVYVSSKVPTPPLTGAPTDIILVVGSALGGPKNVPVTINGVQEYTNIFGDPENLIYDMGTQVMVASSVGAYQFQCVRVTDGTDLEATANILDTASPTPAVGMTITSKYTGTLYNTLQVIISAGTNSTISLPLYKITISFPNGTGNGFGEVYDNIGGSGAVLWQNLVDAINLGQGSYAPPSSLVTAAVGVSTDAPALASYLLSGGATGNSSLDESDLIGSDISPRTGMYSARDTLFNFIILSNATDSSNYVSQVNFAQTEGAYVILSRPQGEDFIDGIAAKKAISFNPEVMPWGKLMVGDWVKIFDPYNNISRFISAQALIAAKLAILPPQQSSLNKPISSNLFLATQSSENNYHYTSGDILQILENGLDVIATPSVGGNYFGAQTGVNLSSNPLASTDSYTRLTGYIIDSLLNNVGQYIGMLASPTEEVSIVSTVKAFLFGMKKGDQIGFSNPAKRTEIPYTVSLDNSQITKGIQILNVIVAYLNVITVIEVNLQGGVSSISSNGQ